MRSIAHRWRAAAFVLLLSAFCIWLIGSSKSFQQCIRDSKRQDASYALEKGIPHLGLMFGRYKACSGVFVTENHEAIGAISTFVIAVFTITLWIATDRLWRTSTRHADHIESQLRVMIAIESPVFTWGEFKLELVHGMASTGILPNNVYQPSVFVKNAGRSPLELRAFCIETVFRDDFRPTYGSQPTYKTIVGLGFMLESGRDVFLSSLETITFNGEEVEMIINFKRILWMYGFVRYFNRLTNETWEAGFIQQWSPQGRFVPYSLPNYNYHRPQKGNSEAALR